MVGRATMRRYQGPADLRAMQRLTQRIWSLDSQCHIGDQAWQRNMYLGMEDLWPTALWELDGEVVAWGWAHLPGMLALLVDPARPELAGDVLDWFAGVAIDRTPRVVVTDAETHVIAALERHGYRPEERPYRMLYMYRRLDDLPEPVLPAGFRARPVRGEDDLPELVAVHQAAWNSTRVTEASYRNVMAAWPYRDDLNWVVEAPDGRFAASCLIWLDEHNRVGELEPVGTDPRFRRMGLGRAVCLAAMHALRAAGATLSVVYPGEGHPDYPASVPLYQNLVFTPYARSVVYLRPPAGSVT